MKTIPLVYSISALVLLFCFSGCDELDPKCDGANYVDMDLISPGPDGRNGVLSNLDHYLKNGTWYFYHNITTSPACGQSTLDIVYSVIFSSALPQKYGLEPVLEIDGNLPRTKDQYGYSPYGDYNRIMQGNFFGVVDVSTPHIFSIKAGFELRGAGNMLETEVLELVKQYFSEVKVRVHYLKL